MKIVTRVGCLLLFISFNAVHLTTAQAEEECTQRPADITLVLDGSNSINYIGWGRELNFAVNFVDALGLDVYRIAYAQFSTKFKKYADFNTCSDINELKQIILSTTQMKLNTDTANMFRQLVSSGTYLESNGRRPEYPCYSLVVTDGRPDNEEAAIQASKDYQAKTGCKVLCLGIGSAVPEVLAKLATSADLVFYVKSFNVINLVLTQITQKICQDSQTTALPPQTTQVKTTTTTPPPQPAPEPETTTSSPEPPPPPPSTTTSPPPTTQATTLPPVTPCTPSYECLHVSHVVDGSSSIGYSNFQRVKDFINRLTPALKGGKLIFSAIVFGTHNYTVSTPTENTDLYKQRIDDMGYRNSSTHTDKGINNAVYFASLLPECKTLMIVTTDGQSTYPDRTSAAAAYAKNQGIFIVAISVGKWTNATELNGIASNGAVYSITGYDKLVALADQIALKACEELPTEPPPTAGPTDLPQPAPEPTTTEAPPPQPPPTTTTAAPPPTTSTTTTTTAAPPPPTTTTTTTSTAAPPPPTTTTTTTTTAAPPPPTTTTTTTTTVAPCVPKYPRMRIGFVIDASGSITLPLFDQNRKMIVSMVKALKSDHLSYAACTFGTHARLVSERTESTEEFLKSLTKATYQNSTTRIDRGLYCVYDAIDANPDPSSNYVVVMITDGQATDSKAALSAAEEIKESGTSIYAVGVGKDINIKELETITRDANGNSHVITVPDYEHLLSAVKPLLDPICGNS